MTNAAKTTNSLPVVNSVASSDRLLVVYNAANSSTAQTATITVQNYELKTLISDPANSSSLVVTQGTVLYSGNFIYVADAPNHLRRVALSSF